MADRKLLRVYCSKTKGAHEVGAVYATDTGAVARLTIAVEGTDGVFGSVQEFRPGDRDSGAMCEAWCESCRKRLPVMPETHVLREVGRRKAVALKAEGMWKDGVGVLTRQRRARRA